MAFQYHMYHMWPSHPVMGPFYLREIPSRGRDQGWSAPAVSGNLKLKRMQLEFFVEIMSFSSKS